MFFSHHIFSINFILCNFFLVQIFQVPTLAGRRFLYFNAITNDNDNVTVTVEGGGVNATLEIPDIAVTNGFVHIIDHVLGIPYATVQEKLATDPMLKWVWKQIF